MANLLIETDEDRLFAAWRDTFPPEHWSKKDLGACRLGWDAGRAQMEKSLTELGRVALDFLAKEEAALGHKEIVGVHCPKCFGRGALSYPGETVSATCFFCNGKGTVIE